MSLVEARGRRKSGDWVRKRAPEDQKELADPAASPEGQE